MTYGLTKEDAQILMMGPVLGQVEPRYPRTSPVDFEMVELEPEPIREG